jgi:hypothetical protein
LAKSNINVAVDLLQAPPQLLDTVCCALDPAGQVAHLRREPIEAQFGIDRCTGTPSSGGAAATAVDLALQHAEIFFQPLEAILRRPILGSR